MKKTLSLAVAALALSFVVTGCSDNEDSSTPAPVAEYNAIFVDAAVAGITWTCGDRTGTTDAEGRFGACEVGVPVSFNMGKISLGTITDTSSFTDPANTIITPTTLARASGDPEVASKVAIALQSFDSDGDPSNGITIDAATITILEGLESDVDLTSPEETVESVEASTAETVALIIEETNNPNMASVTRLQADAHLAETQQQIDTGAIGPTGQPTGATGSN